MSGGATPAGGAGGGATGATVAGGTGASATPLPNGGASLLGRLRAGLPLPVHDHETPATGGELDDYLRTAWGEDHLADADPHPEYLTLDELPPLPEGVDAYTKSESDLRYPQLTQAGQPSGYAPLDAGGLVPTAHLPPLAVTDTFVVASEAAMLALTAQVGDLCIRSDLAKTYVLAATPASTLANWLEVQAAGQVVSVNGETGVVSLSAADVGAYTQAEADGLFLTGAEGDAAYATLDHTHPQVTTGRFHFQTNPAMTKPGSGNFRSNTGAAATATALAMDEIGALGTDITPLFAAMRLGDTVFVQDLNDADQWVRYQLTAAPTLNSGWAQIPVTVVSSGGTIAGSQLCVMQLTLTAGGGGGGGAGVVASDPVWDAKGDLVAGLGADTASRLAVGTNGQLLSADSAQATGLAWVANPVTAHTALPNAHHAQAHDHTTGDGSGVLTDDEHDGFSQYVNLGADPATPAANRIRLYSKDNGSGVSTLYYRSESGTVYEMPTLVTGGGGSGAPANASYVTLAAESKLSGETALGAGVIMSGVVASRPAFGTAGRLYLGTDTDLVYRDTGSAWETFATRAGGGSYLPLTGGTLTGAVVLQGASSSTVVLNAKASADAAQRFRIDAAGKLEWTNQTSGALLASLAQVGGNLELGAETVPTATSTLNLGNSSRYWSNVYANQYNSSNTGVLKMGSAAVGTSGTVQLRNAATLAWRNAGNTANLDLSMNASDHLALTVAAGALTTTVGAAGGASALPATPTGFLTITLNGTSRKIPYYAV